jgi:vitamin K-dependent gamma-carboxylase
MGKGIAQSRRRLPVSAQAPVSGWFWRRCFAPVDIASLAAFRIAFGGLMLWEILRAITGGWVYELFIAPKFHLTYPGFSWVQPLPGGGMQVLFWLLVVAALGMMLGFLYRLSATVFFLGFTWVFLIEATEYLNHFYLICLLSFLMICVPAHRAFSLDAWRKPTLRSDSAPAWTLWLLRAQVGIVYFFGGIAKFGGDWLHGEPLRTWLAARTDFPVLGRWFREEWMVYLVSYSGLLIDLLAVPLLLWKRTRWPGFALVLAFHLMNARLFSIGIFPWLMIAASLLFLAPDWPRRLGLGGRAEPARLMAPTSRFALQGKQRALLAVIACFLTWQCLMPLRHFLYPGDVNWTEEGHLFSWHMKLRDKHARSEFLVTDPARQETWRVDPRQYLTRTQAAVMATQPELIRQFAHYLAEEYNRQGISNLEVRAEVLASLNGRPAQLLVDPRVDLAAEPASLRHRSWIEPLQNSLSLPQKEMRSKNEINPGP